VFGTSARVWAGRPRDRLDRPPHDPGAWRAQAANHLRGHLGADGRTRHAPGPRSGRGRRGRSELQPGQGRWRRPRARPRRSRLSSPRPLASAPRDLRRWGAEGA